MHASGLYINGGRILPHKAIGESVPEPKIIMWNVTSGCMQVGFGGIYHNVFTCKHQCGIIMLVLVSLLRVVNAFIFSYCLHEFSPWRANLIYLTYYEPKSCLRLTYFNTLSVNVLITDREQSVQIACSVELYALQYFWHQQLVCSISDVVGCMGFIVCITANT